MTESVSILVTALLAGIGGAIVNVAIISRSAGKFEGRVNERLDGQETRIDGLEKSRGEQWAKINQHGERIAYCEAKVNGKPAGARS